MILAPPLALMPKTVESQKWDLSTALNFRILFSMSWTFIFGMPQVHLHSPRVHQPSHEDGGGDEVTVVAAIAIN